jgi:hypothetical protein
MQLYGSGSDRSGVSAYRAGSTWIEVQFRKGTHYLYNNASAGKNRIEMMKRLAASGKGLATYISQSVKGRYAAKLK